MCLCQLLCLDTFSDLRTQYSHGSYTLENVLNWHGWGKIISIIRIESINDNSAVMNNHR